jgi:hypothetical protein
LATGRTSVPRLPYINPSTPYINPSTPYFGPRIRVKVSDLQSFSASKTLNKTIKTYKTKTPGGWFFEILIQKRTLRQFDVRSRRRFAQREPLKRLTTDLAIVFVELLFLLSFSAHEWPLRPKCSATFSVMSYVAQSLARDSVGYNSRPWPSRACSARKGQGISSPRRQAVHTRSCENAPDTRFSCSPCQSCLPQRQV